MPAPLPPTSPAPLGTTSAIAVQGLHKSYGSLKALQGIDFTVQSGEIFGLIGPDGAGKTTTFQILAGVMEATAGQVSLLGKPPRQAQLNVGYVTQKFSLYPDLTVMENLRYSAGLRRVPAARWIERVPHLLKQVGLDAFGDRLASNLSGGMKQKLALCCALVANPAVLLLDEPTTGVDPVSRREFWDLLATVASTGVTVVVATPYLDEAERCHRIALIYGGELQQMGTLANLRQGLGLQRLEVWATDIAQAETALQGATVSGLVDIQTFGDRLDILVTDPGIADRQVRQHLAQQHIHVDRMQHTTPTLENVFVNHLRQQGLDPPYLSFPTARPGPSLGKVAIAARSLQKTFGSFCAVDHVDITVRHGEIYGLLGANGAGKTTTIK
ncbi:MAG TPA: ATP-binding cassette domain-containing protein, partial [Candidatus Obscuribacterales bacterium]